MSKFKQNISIGLLLLIVLLITNINSSHNNTIDTYQRYSLKTSKSFDDVMYDLKTAIQDNNYRITAINRIGEAIAKNNEDDFIEVTIVSFCNIDIAKKFIQQSLSYILYMPCRIVVYEKGDDVMIETYLLSQENSLHKQVNIIIKNIVDIAAQL